MNRGIYIQIVDNEGFQEKIFWNETSDIYTFLRNHTRKIEFKYDKNFTTSANNVIPTDAIIMLIDGIKKDLDFLIEEYNNHPISVGLNSIEIEYDFKNYSLDYKSSKLHLMIWNLIRLFRRLELVKDKDQTLFVFGNANIDENILQSLILLRNDFKKNGDIAFKN